MYNEALLINAVCQTLDALKYVHDDLEQIKQSYPNETEVWLENIFKGCLLFVYHTLIIGNGTH